MRRLSRWIENASPVLGNMAHQIPPAICGQLRFKVTDALVKHLIFSRRDRTQMVRQGSNSLRLGRERCPPRRNLSLKLSIAQSRDWSCAALSFEPAYSAV